MLFNGSRSYFNSYYSRLDALKKSLEIAADVDKSSSLVVTNLNAKGKSNFYYEKDSVVQVDWFGKGLFVRATIDHYDKKKILFDISYPNGIKEYGVPLNRLKEPFRSGDSVLIYDTNNYTTGKLQKATIVKDNLDGTFNIHVQAAKRNGKTNKLLITLDGYNIHEIVSDKLVCEGNYVRIDWEYRHKTSGILYAARITKVNGDGTCDVAYLEDLAIDKVQTDQIFRPFMPDEAVTCYWMRSDRAHKGKIQKVNADNTFDILYDDNDVEKGVPANYILLQESYANRPWLNKEETNLNKIRKQTSDIKEIKKDLEDLGYIRSERQIKTKFKILLKSKEEEDQLKSVSECAIKDVYTTLTSNVPALSQKSDYAIAPILNQHRVDRDLSFAAQEMDSSIPKKFYENPCTMNIIPYDPDLSIAPTLQLNLYDRDISIPLKLYNDPFKFLKMPFLTCSNYESHYTFDEYKGTINCIHKAWTKKEIESEINELIKLTSLNDRSMLAMILQARLRNKYDRRFKKRVVTGDINIDACYEYCSQVVKYL